MPSLFLEIGRVRGLSYDVRNITAHHVPRGGAFLLHLGSTDQADGSARRGRLGSSSIPDKVYILLGMCLPRRFWRGSLGIIVVFGVPRSKYPLAWYAPGGLAVSPGPSGSERQEDEGRTEPCAAVRFARKHFRTMYSGESDTMMSIAGDPGIVRVRRERSTNRSSRISRR